MTNSFHDLFIILEQSGLTKQGIEQSDSRSSACRDNRISKIYHDVTLNGGISSGEFTDKGHVTSMDQCIGKCCASDSCNVAFVIKDTCFAVKCKTYDECGLKAAVSDYYNPRIAYVNWSPPKELTDGM